MLEKSQDELEEPENSSGNGNSRADDIITKLNQVFPQKEARPGFDKEILTHAPDEKQQQVIQQKDKGKKKVEEIVEVEANKTLASVGIENNKSFEGKERALVRSESARTLRRIPSSPLLLGMRKKKSMVTGDDDCNGDYATRNSFIKSSIKTIKKAVKI